MEANAYTELPLGQLMQIYEKNDGKHCIVFDKNGNCGTFFAYQAALIDFDKEVMKVTVGSQTKEEALEKLRNKTALTMGGLA